MEYIFKDFNEINSKEQGKLLKSSVVPRPIAWISTHNEMGITNVAPFSFFSMLTSSLVSVSIQRIGKLKKDTSRNILLTNEAVLNIASLELIKELDLTSKELDSNISELSLTNLNLINSNKINTKGIKESLIRLETKLVEHIKLYDYTNTFVEADMFILRTVGVTVNKEIYDSSKNYIDVEKLKPLSRLNGPYYGTTNIIKDFKREF